MALEKETNRANIKTIRLRCAVQINWLNKLNWFQAQLETQYSCQKDFPEQHSI